MVAGTSSRKSWLILISHTLGIGILVGASSYFVLDKSAVSGCLQQVLSEFEGHRTIDVKGPV
jgi:hypothetical protein